MKNYTAVILLFVALYNAPYALEAQTSFGTNTGTGVGCSMFGINAGTFNSLSASSINNTYIGQQAGYAISYGTNNTFIGFASGLNSRNVSNCIFMGSLAGSNADNISNSVFIGNNSGRYCYQSAGNTCVGYEAGGNGSFVLGYNCSLLG
ncbi:MAG: hypothetical protein ACRC3B_18570, partial [Bacteroidia bacterium]